jgi:hypothetical protein
LNAFFLFVAVFFASFAAASALADPHEADRQALRDLLVEIERAINANDIASLLPYLDDNVVITHQNAHVAHGRQAVVSYNEKMTQGPDAPIKKLTTKATIGGPAYFHGDDTAIGYGTAVDQVELQSGQSFTLDVAWSATLIKRAGAWKAAAIHFSTNVLDNAILRQARKLIWWAAAGGVLLGLVVGWLLGRRRQARSA